MARELVGCCGETSEWTAARIHRYAAIVMGFCVLAEAAAFGLHLIMAVWHKNSVGTHAQRAVENGE